MTPPLAPGAPDVECEMHHTTLEVTDVPAAVDFYTNRLGFWTAFVVEDSTFAGVNLGNVQIFLAKGTPDPSGFSMYFVVGDADELHEFHRSKGVEITDPPEDRPYALRDYGVKDLHGHQLRFGHRLSMADGPPLRIERVDVPLRLEKRLAALLIDLAAYKRMSLTSCVEEILLHTNEPLGDGVASPHTRRQLAHIQELKRKHGIDYDSHASYRFTEE